MEQARILVVDDERWIRVNLKRILEAEDHSVMMADCGEAALKLLEQQAVDLVLSDHRMPRMTGLELLEVVKDKYPNTIRVMLTGFADLQLALDAINRVEIHRLLLKPYSREQIVATIQELVELKAAGVDIAPVDLNHARIRKTTMDSLQEQHPGIDQVTRDRRGRIVLSDDDLDDAMGNWSDIEDILGVTPKTEANQAVAKETENLEKKKP